MANTWTTWQPRRARLALAALVALAGTVAGCGRTAMVDLGAGRQVECAPADALGPLKVTPDTAGRMSVLYEQHRQGRLTAEAFCREAWSVLAFREYRHPRHGWSLSYPAAWVIEQARPDVVKLRSPRGTPLELEAVVEVRTQSPVPAHIHSAHELAAELAPTYERAARDRVLPIMWRSRSAIRLRNDLPAYDTINDLGTLQQGRSRKVYLVVGRDAYVLDTEAALDSWRQLSPVFDLIISSFTVPARS
jgi:hypothetical protein